METRLSSMGGPMCVLEVLACLAVLSVQSEGVKTAKDLQNSSVWSLKRFL